MPDTKTRTGLNIQSHASAETQSIREASSFTITQPVEVPVEPHQPLDIPKGQYQYQELPVSPDASVATPETVSAVSQLAGPETNQAPIESVPGLPVRTRTEHTTQEEQNIRQLTQEVIQGEQATAPQINDASEPAPNPSAPTSHSQSAIGQADQIVPETPTLLGQLKMMLGGKGSDAADWNAELSRLEQAREVA